MQAKTHSMLSRTTASPPDVDVDVTGLLWPSDMWQGVREGARTEAGAQAAQHTITRPLRSRTRWE
jgi:hypothetical protein